MWKGKEGVAIGAKVSWEHLCVQKDEGGLGLKRVVDWNMDCLAKIVWMLFRGPDTLWITWVRKKFYVARVFWEVNVAANSSWCWSGTLKLREIFRLMILYVLLGQILLLEAEKTNSPD